MAVVDLYASVAEHIDFLRKSGEDWNLCWFEGAFEYRLMRGSKSICRAPYISQICKWTSLEVEQRKLKCKS